MPKLYELAENFKALEEKLLEADDADIRELLQDSLESIEASLEHKLEGMVALMKNFQGEADMYKAERQRLQAKEAAAQRKADSIKAYMDHTLKSLGFNGDNKRKIQAGMWKLRVQKNPASVEILDEEKIPESFIVLKKEIAKKDLLKALKEGMEIDGAILKQSESIRIG